MACKYYCDRCGVECKGVGGKLDPATLYAISLEIVNYKKRTAVLCGGCRDFLIRWYEHWIEGGVLVIGTILDPGGVCIEANTKTDPKTIPKTTIYEVSGTGDQVKESE